jgi:hypothetical protein
MGLKKCRKTYPLRNEWQKNRRQFGGLYRFVYCLAIEKRWKEALPILVHVFEQ